MKAQTITAHFATLRKAVHEAHKYGCPQKLTTVQNSIRKKGIFLHYITQTRILSISRDRGDQWKLAVDVQGRVVPVGALPTNRLAVKAATPEPA